MTVDELLRLLTTVRRATTGNGRAPHKPLLLLWLLGRLSATGRSAVTYDEAAEPVSRLINDFGPAVAGPARARDRAAMPFVHLERDLWELRDLHGEPIGPGERESGAVLRRRQAHGRLRPEVEALLADSRTLAAAARVLLDRHFTPALEGAICTAVGLDLTDLELAACELVAARRRSRRAGFTEEVLRAYAYACAMCGFDGALGRNPVGLEAAHVRWHSHEGPDEVSNGVALCSLHHTLFDLGALGLTAELRIQVSELYVARSPAGLTIDNLHDRPLNRPRRGQPAPASAHLHWHGHEVFKGRIGTAA